jgi:hypothetical protein
MSMAMEHPPDRRLIGFLAISVALHALWLAVPLHNRTWSPEPPPSIEARLLPRLDRTIEPAHTEPARKSAVAVWNAPNGVRLHETPITAGAPETPGNALTTPPSIDLDAAHATARAYAREAQPRTTLDAPKPLLTVETAIARATEADVAIETHGAAGEYVTQTRHSRCVTPVFVPHFLEGKTMLTQCEVRKG